MFALLLCLLVAVEASTPRLQRALSKDKVFDAKTPHVVPKKIFEFLEEFNWGDYHQIFHLVRKYYVVGDKARAWMKKANVLKAELQEGDPLNGIEFLAMHRAMIEHLRENFGDERVSSDPDGRRTFAEVLDGWKSDAELEDAWKKAGKDVRELRSKLRFINKFDNFETEDDFGLFLQTRLRLKEASERRGTRSYGRDNRPGAGIHNTLHGAFQDKSSPINVGSARVNLLNILFWRIHGWIDRKWAEFEKSRTRTAEEMQWYTTFMDKFRKRMKGMSLEEEQAEDDARAQSQRGQSAVDEVMEEEEAAPGTGRSLNALRLGWRLFGAKIFRVLRFGKERVPQDIIHDTLPVIFSDKFECKRYAPNVRSEDCYFGPMTKEGEPKHPIPASLDRNKFIAHALMDMRMINGLKEFNLKLHRGDLRDRLDHGQGRLA